MLRYLRSLSHALSNTVFHRPFSFTTTEELVWRRTGDKSALPRDAVVPFVRGHNSSVASVSGDVADRIEVRVMNIHVHSKTLWRFTRRRPGTDFVDLRGSYVPLEEGLRVAKLGNLGD